MNGRGKRLARLDETHTACGGRRVERHAAPLRPAESAARSEAEALGAEVCFDHALSGSGAHSRRCRAALRQWRDGPGELGCRLRRRLVANPAACFPGCSGARLHRPHRNRRLRRPAIGAGDRRVHAHGVRRKAFFGYIKEGAGPVFWFDSFPLDEDAALAKPDRWRTRHAGPQAACQRSGTGPRDHRRPRDACRAAYPVFDMQHLPRWHDGPVVLLGDAAHAVSPHAGQGAAMAIEDAVVLAACVSARASPEQAFAAFQALRQERVERIVRVSRRIGSQKRAIRPLRAVPARPHAALGDPDQHTGFAGGAPLPRRSWSSRPAEQIVWTRDDGL